MRIYAGIGSRQTPPEVCSTMEAIGAYLAEQGWLLRSGGAEGADLAFESGCDSAGGRKRIHRPEDYLPAAWFEVAEQYHPAWHRCKEAARRLHARNTPIILGADLKSPAHLVVCWTPGAKGEGGTGQGIRIARAHGIPVFDLADLQAKADLKVWLRGAGAVAR